jgi:hypothetical protein
MPRVQRGFDGELPAALDQEMKTMSVKVVGLLVCVTTLNAGRFRFRSRMVYHQHPQRVLQRVLRAALLRALQNRTESSEILSMVVRGNNVEIEHVALCCFGMMHNPREED